MKKLMLGAAVAAMAITTAAPSFAREVTEVVGYVKTTTTINERDAEFARVDENHDGAINFNEFMRNSMFENEYEMFNMNDTNNDDLLSLDEFRTFSKWSPERVSTGPNGTNTNFNKPSVRNRTGTSN